jgi:hypothetical protein
MINLVKRLLHQLLWDEATAQRVLAAGLFLIASFLETGGVIPGTSIVVPITALLGSLAAPASSLGPLLKAGAIYLGASGAIVSSPRTMNGRV